MVCSCLIPVLTTLCHVYCLFTCNCFIAVVVSFLILFIFGGGVSLKHCYILCMKSADCTIVLLKRVFPTQWVGLYVNIVILEEPQEIPHPHDPLGLHTSLQSP